MSRLPSVCVCVCGVCLVGKMELRFTLRGCTQSIMSVQFDQNVRSHHKDILLYI